MNINDRKALFSLQNECRRQEEFYHERNEDLARFWFDLAHQVSQAIYHGTGLIVQSSLKQDPIIKAGEQAQQLRKPLPI